MTIIGFIGMIGMVLLSMLGVSFLGKVGGAEGIPRLRESLLARHGVNVDDPATFKVRPYHVDEGEERRKGLLIRFRPKEEVARSDKRVESLSRGIAYQIFSQPKWAKRLDFVEVVLQPAASEEIRCCFTKDEALTTIGGRRAPRSVAPRRPVRPPETAPPPAQTPARVPEKAPK
jgi:hypothetical protein